MILKTLKAHKISKNHPQYLTGQVLLYSFQEGFENLNLLLLSLILESVFIILTSVDSFCKMSLATAILDALLIGVQMSPCIALHHITSLHFN